MNWETVKLSEVCELVQYGYTTSATDNDTGVKFLRITDIVPEFINWDDVPFCEIEEKEQAKYKLYAGDIVIARTGATVGYAKRLRDNIPEVVFASYLIRIRPNESVDDSYIGHVVESDVYKEYINCIASGAAQPNANAQDLISFSFPLPPLPLQRQIAAVLGRYDALLENYQGQVAALEGLAQELYREWFVRGRCPGAEVGSAGELPAGWSRVKLFDIAKITYGFPFNSSLFNEDDDGKPVVRIRDVLDSTTKTYTPEEAPEKYLLKNGDILVGMDGEFHIAKWTGGEAYLNQRVLRASPASGIPRYFLYYAIKPPIQFLNSIIVGTTVAHLGDADLRKVEIILPDSASLAEFTRITDPIFDKVINLEAQIIILRATRDALLPRLLSGQLVPAATA